MKASGTDGGAPHRDGRVDFTAAERVRAPREDFDRSLEELQQEVCAACSSQSSWQAKIAAGLRTALGFAAAHPAKAYALTIAARRETTPGGNREAELVAYFAEQLADCAPWQGAESLSTATCLVESVATVVRGELLAQLAPQLPRLAPDLLYLLLMPYAGIAEARQWARAVESTSVGRSKYDY